MGGAEDGVLVGRGEAAGSDIAPDLV